MDTVFAMQRRYMELLARMVSEPIAVMTQLPRANLRPALNSVRELMDAHEESIQVRREIVDVTETLFDRLLGMPNRYADIMARAINAPIETSVLKFRQEQEETEHRPREEDSRQEPRQDRQTARFHPNEDDSRQDRQARA
jgi:hypothetical protein